MTAHTRHKLVFYLLRPVLRILLRLKFRFRFKRVSLKDGPYLILANHTTDWDPLLLSAAVNRHLYFVASEHIFRWGRLSRLIVWLQAPIARLKGTADTTSVRTVLQHLKAGHNVAIFPEGCRSYNGLTGEIPDSVGKLARHSGAGLITFRLEGGYLTSPRWGARLRRGPMCGAAAHVLSPEQLAAMSVQEINALVREDLFVDARVAQQAHPAAYRGKGLAEHLENALYLCPECERLASLQSRGDELSCTCGLRLRYTPEGFLIAPPGGRDAPFPTVTDWDLWQQARLWELADAFFAAHPQEPLLCAPGQRLARYSRMGDEEIVLEDAVLSLFSDRMQLRSPGGACLDFPFDTLSGISSRGRNVLMLTVSRAQHYEIRSAAPRAVAPFLSLYRRYKLPPDQILNPTERK